jgi:hypothetical protein
MKNTVKKIVINQVADRNLTANKAARQMNALRTEFPEAEVVVYHSLRNETSFSFEIENDGWTIHNPKGETRNRIAEILK